MLREKVPKFHLVSGDHAIEVVITATIISTGMPETLDPARYGGAGGVVMVGDMVQQSARTLGKLGRCCEVNAEASTLAIEPQMQLLPPEACRCTPRFWQLQLQVLA